MKGKSHPKTIKLKTGEIKLEHRYPLRVLFISDLHCGEQFGIQPPEFETSDGRILLPNTVQKIIYRQWERIKEVADQYHVQYIFVVGDLLGGLNPKEKGKYITCDMKDQVRMATKLLAEIAKDRIMYIISGTRYHLIPRGMGEPEEEVAIRLRDMGYKAYYIGDIAFIEIEGVKRKRRIFVAHEAPTGLVYPATLMSRDINWARQSQAEGKTPPVDAIVRAHLHFWLHVDHSGIHAIQLPCFMGLTPYKSTIKYFFRLQPDIGGVLMLVDEYGRLRFWHFLLPREERIKMLEGITTIQPISLKNYEEIVNETRRYGKMADEAIKYRKKRGGKD